MNQCCNDQLAVEPRRIFQGQKNLTRILNPNCENEHLTAEQSVSMVQHARIGEQITFKLLELVWTVHDLVRDLIRDLILVLPMPGKTRSQRCKSDMIHFANIQYYLDMNNKTIAGIGFSRKSAECFGTFECLRLQWLIRTSALIKLLQK